jgi:hypothetical protein
MSFGLEDPLAINHLLARTRWDNLPSIIMNQGIVLLLHSLLPLWRPGNKSLDRYHQMMRDCVGPETPSSLYHITEHLGQSLWS